MNNELNTTNDDQQELNSSPSDAPRKLKEDKPERETSTAPQKSESFSADDSESESSGEKGKDSWKRDYEQRFAQKLQNRQDDEGMQNAPENTPPAPEKKAAMTDAPADPPVPVTRKQEPAQESNRFDAPEQARDEQPAENKISPVVTVLPLPVRKPEPAEEKVEEKSEPAEDETEKKPGEERRKLHERRPKFQDRKPEDRKRPKEERRPFREDKKSADRPFEKKKQDDRPAQPAAEETPQRQEAPARQESQPRPERQDRQQRPQQKKRPEREEPQPRVSFKKISIVIPLFNEAESLQPLANEIKNTMKDFHQNYEVIFVDDGSTDNSLRVLKQLCKTEGRFKYISFQKNFGKSAALQTGFNHASGDVVVTMDADLQDDPHEIPDMIKKLGEGYDLVSGWKKKRYDPFIKRMTSRFFNFVTSVFSGIKIHDFNCGLKVYRKSVVRNLSLYGELHRYIPVLAKWKGFRVTEKPVHHHPRKYGKTKFGISRFFKGFIDLVTVVFITRYVKRPMHLFGFLGFFTFLAGLIINIVLTVEKVADNAGLSNRPLLFLGMLLMIVGIQFFSTGLLGEMMVHNFQSEKEYTIREKNI